jgi:hypothetical protein
MPRSIILTSAKLVIHHSQPRARPRRASSALAYPIWVYLVECHRQRPGALTSTAVATLGFSALEGQEVRHLPRRQMWRIFCGIEPCSCSCFFILYQSMHKQHGLMSGFCPMDYPSARHILTCKTLSKYCCFELGSSLLL